MFGYIKPCRGELRVREFEAYRGVYCGLCRQIGKVYGQLARCTLNYDYAFLAMLELNISQENITFCPHRCAAHPFHRRPCVQCEHDLSFSAAAAMLMLKEKLEDKKSDDGISGKVSACFVSPFISHWGKKAANNYPNLSEICKNLTKMQKQAEENPNCSIDEAAHPTAETLGLLLQELSEETVTKRILYRLGYCIGRWIYLADALDDLEQDEKKHRFNPLLKMNFETREAMLLYMQEVMQQTAAEAAAAYELLPTGEFSPILENTIYLGMKQEQDRLLKEKRSAADERSLSGTGRSPQRNGGTD